MKTTSKLLLLAVFGLSFSFCKKDSKTEPEPTPTPSNPTTGTLSLYFENRVDTLPLQFDSLYVNTNGDTFSVTKLNYYISNIILTKNDGSTFAEPESYHLVKHSDGATYWINIKNVPYGSYKSVKFTVGVDSARNVSGAQSGDLSLTKAGDMFWSWNTGYIFFKMEGKAPRSADPTKTIEYHIGGYGGMYKTQREVLLNFNTATANVSSAISPKVHLYTNVNNVFNSASKIDFSKPNYFSIIMPGPYSVEIANNYATMFSYGHIHND